MAGVDEAASRRIGERLDRLSEEEPLRIVLACESGSRAWGFPSKDSDFDVRFLFLRPLEWYLAVESRRDVIEDEDGDLDVGGWDIRKAFALLRRSNCPLFEWLDSPIRYRCDRLLLEPLEALAARSFRPRTATHHYLAMVRRILPEIRTAKPIKLKSYCYSIRSLLAAGHVVENRTPPPMSLGPLLESALGWRSPPPRRISRLIGQLVTEKSRAVEADRVDSFPALDAFLIETFESLEARVPGERDRLPAVEADAAFLEILRRSGELPAGGDASG